MQEDEKNILRELARRVAEIAADPVNDVKRDMWKRLNRLERVRPLVHVQAVAANIWEELIPQKELRTTDSFARRQEMELRKTIYCWENFRDDRVVDDTIACPIVVEGFGGKWVTNFGVSKKSHRPDDPSGARAFEAVIVEEKDIEKIQTEPQWSPDWEQTELNYQRLCDIYDGILRVEKRGTDFFWFAPMDTFIEWRGIEQAFIDLIERPQWIHAVLERMVTGYINGLERCEKLHLLSPGNGNVRLGSGGYGWTDELPQSDFDGRHVRLKDLWARAATQIYVDVSPEMHDEFAVQYEKRLLERFGLSCYGCCEPLDRKMHVVRKIRNLRRVSMSPWVDVERASREVGRDYVYTHKPNPSVVSMHHWDLELARSQLRDALEKTRNNVLEVTLQDLHTLHNEPRRLTEWTAMALQLAEEYA